MHPRLKRFMLAIGVVLILGGWGVSRYTDQRQESIKERDRTKAWDGNSGYMSGKTLYTGAILGMALGGILVVTFKN